MKRAVVLLIVSSTLLGACGTTGTPSANLATAQPSITPGVGLPTSQPAAAALTPIQGPTMEDSQPSGAGSMPTAPATAPTDPAQPAATAAEAADQTTNATQPAFQASPIAGAPDTGGTIGTPTGQIDSALGRLVAGVRADLAKRRGVAVDTIEVVEARSVTWPDPGLGCPQPGMAYKQVPVDGVLICLRVDGISFNYHGGGGRAPFLCEQPAQDTTPGPAPGFNQ